MTLFLSPAMALRCFLDRLCKQALQCEAPVAEASLSRTKVLWGVAPEVLAQTPPAHLAMDLAALAPDALRLQVRPGSLGSIQALRQALQNLPASETPARVRHLPFVVSLAGRRAQLYTPKESPMEWLDGQSLSFRLCPLGMPPEDLGPQEVAFGLSSTDWEAPLQHPGTLLNVSYGQLQALVVGWNPSSQTGELRISLGGTALHHMDVHSPAFPQNLFPLVQMDSEALAQGLGHEADYVLVHGVRTVQDVLELRRVLFPHAKGSSTSRHPTVPVGDAVRSLNASVPARLILKVESRETVESLSLLLGYVDGILLSRAELCLTTASTELPVLQKQIIAQCNQRGKLVVVASELLYSMRIHPNPTRAEVSDVANAVADGTDALLISEEVTAGPFGKEAMSVLRDTLSWSEDSALTLATNWSRVPFQVQNSDDAIAWGAIEAARLSQAKAIVCLSEGGFTVMRLATLRPPSPIFAVTLNQKILRQLQILNRVTGFVLESMPPIDALMPHIRTELVKNSSLQKGDRFVFVSLTASPVSTRNSNIFSIQTIL